MIERLVPPSVLHSIENYSQIVAGGIIYIPGTSGILFLRRSQNDFMPGAWEIPSGGVEKGETLLQALTREIKEETNLNVISVNSYKSSVSYMVNDRSNLQINFNVYCSGVVKLSHEHSEYLFSKPDEFKGNLDLFMHSVLQLN